MANSGLPKPQRAQPCTCGSGKLFEACCESLLSGQRPASTAEELMRSRFTAHVAQDFVYLHRTYLETAKKPYVEETPTTDISWTKLEIHAHEPGSSPDIAFVEFSAYFVEGGADRVLQEKSEFRRIDSQWYYTRTVRYGPAPFKSVHPKVGRNDPCPCGSGKKYKQCCLSKT